MVHPKIIFLKYQLLDSSELTQALLERNCSKLKEVLLDEFKINLNNTKQTYFWPESDGSPSNFLTIITVYMDGSFSANSLEGDVIRDLKNFL